MLVSAVAKLADASEGHVGNFNLYNDKELFEEADLDWYDYGFRNYDPQIGRFPQLDPLTNEYPELTPYQYTSNDPITNIDIDGLEGGIATTAATAKVLDEVVVVGYKTASKVTTSALGIVNAASKITFGGLKELIRESENSPGSGGAVNDWWQDISNNYVNNSSKLGVIKNALNEAWIMTANKIQQLKKMEFF